jgi:hypothetical protein
LIEMAPVIQEEGIIVAYQPRQNSSQLRVVNANAQSATVLLERGFLPEPGTLLALQTNTTLPGTYEKPDLGFQYPDNWVLRETPHGDCSDCLEVRIATSEDYFGSINGPGGLAAIYLEPSYIIEDKDIQSLLRDTLIPAFLSKIPLIVHTSVPITIVEDKRDGQLHKTTGEFEFDIDSVSFFGRGTIIHDLAESKVVVIISYFTKDFIEEFDAGYRLILESLDF